MLGQFLIGGAASACNITIHALVMVVIIRVSRVMGRKTIWSSPSLQLISTMVASVLVLMAAHTLEVIVWASVYFIIGAAPAGAGLVYFAFVNYTTLGYGDVIPGRAMAAAWPDDGDEWRAAIRLVNRCYFRGAAEGSGTQFEGETRIIEWPC